MHIHKYMAEILFLVSSIFPLLLLSCGSDRVYIEFKTSRQIYVDDTKTDPEKLNKELEYDIREAEKKRIQKERAAEAEAKAKAEAELKGKEAQGEQERVTEEESPQTNEAEP